METTAIALKIVKGALDILRTKASFQKALNEIILYGHVTDETQAECDADVKTVVAEMSK